jgi:hypothetical protein
MSRAHLSRVYRPRLVAMVADELLADMRQAGLTSTSRTIVDESNSGLRLA